MHAIFLCKDDIFGAYYRCWNPVRMISLTYKANIRKLLIERERVSDFIESRRVVIRDLRFPYQL